jgi:uncharacterized protein YdhG (YjbR/CyaY superfamily)
MPRQRFESVDEYIASQPEEVRGTLEEVRAAMRKALPRAEEVISYQIPAYRTSAGTVVYFAGFKNHYSVYPATKTLVAALAADERWAGSYKVSKSTLQFSYDRPVPVALIQHIAKLKAAEADEERRAKLVRRAASRK